MTTTPTASTSSHFSTAASRAGVSMALERDSDLAHARDVAELGDREAHPGRLEVAGDERADVLGQGFQQLEAPLGELRRDSLHDLAVVNGVVDVVGTPGLVAGNADLDVHLECLRALLLPLVDSHPGVDAELPDEDRIHGLVL